MEISTGSGLAQAELDEPASPGFLLALTHGAGGGVAGADLLAAAAAARQLGGAVARVIQPYRVRGGRAPGPADRQDAAWLEIVGVLRRRFPRVPLVQGGRSNGARLACRRASRGRARFPAASARSSGALPAGRATRGRR